MRSCCKFKACVEHGSSVFLVLTQGILKEFFFSSKGFEQASLQRQPLVEPLEDLSSPFCFGGTVTCDAEPTTTINDSQVFVILQKPIDLLSTRKLIGRSARRFWLQYKRISFISPAPTQKKSSAPIPQRRDGEDNHQDQADIGKAQSCRIRTSEKDDQKSKRTSAEDPRKSARAARRAFEPEHAYPS